MSAHPKMKSLQQITVAVIETSTHVGFSQQPLIHAHTRALKQLAALCQRNLINYSRCAGAQ
ncbi:hypothetical protein JOB18_043856 [Solea senegalensis]|uniref:Uncharacterized protein n=1 Tax=Solea senegalensis TaxID=28829 RepID=A0AAV6S6Z7_SOLSE|nr:hypothetical protein JOB18_043856 [Solea senegalensis]